jgi:hypothetical protein
MTELARMFKEGQGSKSKAVRYNAERAVMELNAGLLVNRWDQKLICSIGKVKSFFGRKHQAEESENDSNRKASDSITVRQARGEKLLADNLQCEQAILAGVTTLELADVSCLHRLSVGLLRAFVKCRLLDNATSTLLDQKMPPKGTLKQNQDDDAMCEKTKTPFLSRFAFDLRSDPVKAKVVDPTENEVDQGINQDLFDQANNAQTEEVEFLDDLANDITLETQNMIEEIDDVRHAKGDDDSDDEDEYGFESDEE